VPVADSGRVGDVDESFSSSRSRLGSRPARGPLERRGKRDPLPRMRVRWPNPPGTHAHVLSPRGAAAPDSRGKHPFNLKTGRASIGASRFQAALALGAHAPSRRQGRRGGRGRRAPGRPWSPQSPAPWARAPTRRGGAMGAARTAGTAFRLSFTWEIHKMSLVDLGSFEPGQ